MLLALSSELSDFDKYLTFANYPPFPAKLSHSLSRNYETEIYVGGDVLKLNEMRTCFSNSKTSFLV